MYDEQHSNIFLHFYFALAIGAEVSDLMILMVGRKKVFEKFSILSARAWDLNLRILLKKVFLGF